MKTENLSTVRTRDCVVEIGQGSILIDSWERQQFGPLGGFEQQPLRIVCNADAFPTIASRALIAYEKGDEASPITTLYCNPTGRGKIVYDREKSQLIFERRWPTAKVRSFLVWPTGLTKLAEGLLVAYHEHLKRTPTP